MRTDPYPHSLRRGILACLVFGMLVADARAQSFSDRIHRVPAPDAGSAGEFTGDFRGVARWGGRLFILYEAACFWSVDGGRAWVRQDFAYAGPKGPAPGLPGAWFTRAAEGLWLNSRDRALAWRFDPAAGVWRAWDAGAFAMAAAGWGDRLYALTPDHRLRLTRNAGDTWGEIPLPAAVREGTFFDDLLAEGDHLVLQAGPSDTHLAAYSLDGGATWAFLAPRALPILAHGRLYAFRDSLLTVYRPGAESLSRWAAPTRAAFADSAGTLFSLCDSGLYALNPADGGSWRRMADAEELRGWAAGREILYRREGDTLAWFDGLPESLDGIGSLEKRRRSGGAPRFGFDPAGPALPWIAIPGGRRDPLGRGIR
jgi:hypothetical protein